MATLMLGTLHVDRCSAHGVWFDGGELAEALLSRSAEKPPAKPLDVGEVAREAAGVMLVVVWIVAEIVLTS